MDRSSRPYVRLILHRCGSKYTRVTFREVWRNDFDSSLCWSAELWTWFRVERRWELALVARGSRRADAARTLLDAVLEM